MQPQLPNQPDPSRAAVSCVSCGDRRYVLPPLPPGSTEAQRAAQGLSGMLDEMHLAVEAMRRVGQHDCADQIEIALARATVALSRVIEPAGAGFRDEATQVIEGSAAE